MDRGALSVLQALHHLRDGRTVLQAPKTAKGQRRVALPPSATLVLRSLREREEADSALMGASLADDQLVFSRPDGAPLLPDTVTHAFA